MTAAAEARSCISVAHPDRLEDILPEPGRACQMTTERGGRLHTCAHGGHPAHGAHPNRHRCVCGYTWPVAGPRSTGHAQPHP